MSSLDTVSARLVRFRRVYSCWGENQTTSIPDTLRLTYDDYQCLPDDGALERDDRIITPLFPTLPIPLTEIFTS